MFLIAFGQNYCDVLQKVLLSIWGPVSRLDLLNLKLLLS